MCVLYIIRMKDKIRQIKEKITEFRNHIYFEELTRIENCQE